MSDETITGLEQLQESIEKLSKISQEFGNELLKRVQDKTHVRSGKQKSSWQLTVQEGVMALSNTATDEKGVPYTIFDEFGTAHMPGQFIVTTTVQESPDILSVAKNKVGL